MASGETEKTFSFSSSSSTQDFASSFSRAAMTAAVPHPSNAYQLVTASADGVIAVWDTLDVSLVRVSRIPFCAFVLHISLHILVLIEI